MTTTKARVIRAVSRGPDGGVQLALRFGRTPPTAEQQAAYEAVRRALRDGTLTRPVNCEQCGEPEETGAHAHHHRGYAPEHALDVVWLCRRCHARAHRPRSFARRRP